MFTITISITITVSITISIVICSRGEITRNTSNSEGDSTRRILAKVRHAAREVWDGKRPSRAYIREGVSERRMSKDLSEIIVKQMDVVSFICTERCLRMIESSLQSPRL